MYNQPSRSGQYRTQPYALTADTHRPGMSPGPRPMPRPPQGDRGLLDETQGSSPTPAWVPDDMPILLTRSHPHPLCRVMPDPDKRPSRSRPGRLRAPALPETPRASRNGHTAGTHPSQPPGCSSQCCYPRCTCRCCGIDSCRAASSETLQPLPFGSPP